jgi:hypothetical protein
MFFNLIHVVFQICVVLEFVPTLDNEPTRLAKVYRNKIEISSHCRRRKFIFALAHNMRSGKAKNWKQSQFWSIK